MSEVRSASLELATDAVASSPSVVADWRKLADQRLAHLVELEHDHAVMRDRLALLQVDYREVLVAGEDRLRRIAELDRERVKLEERLDQLAKEYASMHASFVGSRSWRVTRPLRAISTWLAPGRRGIGSVLRAMLRIPGLRRAARIAVRLVPGLHSYLRARLYSQASDEHGNDP